MIVLVSGVKYGPPDWLLPSQSLCQHYCGCVHNQIKILTSQVMYGYQELLDMMINALYSCQ